MTISAHDHLAAVSFAKGKATFQILEAKLFSPDADIRRIATIALAIRHPIYARDLPPRPCPCSKPRMRRGV